MLPVDVVSAYIICGAGCLVGAGVMMLARPSDERSRSALRLCGAAFVVLGICLGQFVFGAPVPGDLTVLVAVQGTIVGTTLLAWGFARLNDRCIARRYVLAALATGTAAAWGASAWGLHALNIAYGGIALLIAAWIVVLQWNYVVAPRNTAERAMGYGLLAYGVTWAVRLAYAVSYEGPPPGNFFYAPLPVQSLFAIFYGVIPIIIACLVLNLVNARLGELLVARASSDELTGAFTRRALYERAPAFMAAAARDGRRVAVLLLDLDHFKQINDSHGHLSGDAVLRHAASVLQQNLRVHAVLARFGGEEFVVVLGVDDLHSARRVADRLRTALTRQPFMIGAKAVTVTASIGVALLEAGEQSLDAALQRADQALYRAKDRGRNRVEAWVARAA